MKTKSKVKATPRTKTRTLPGTVDALLSLPEFAAALSLCERHVNRLIARGELPPHDKKIGRVRRWKVSTYQQYINGEWTPTATERLEVDADY